jgi:hypothetical protein
MRARPGRGWGTGGFRCPGRSLQRGLPAEDLAFVYRHCPFEAWALARAQCERGDETVSPRYAAFCRDFKNGRAPVAGAAP